MAILCACLSPRLSVKLVDAKGEPQGWLIGVYRDTSTFSTNRLYRAFGI